MAAGKGNDLLLDSEIAPCRGHSQDGSFSSFEASKLAQSAQRIIPFLFVQQKGGVFKSTQRQLVKRQCDSLALVELPNGDSVFRDRDDEIPFASDVNFPRNGLLQFGYHFALSRQ